MFVYEAIIVYFAAGAPFAVINVLKNRKASTLDLWLGALTAFLLWLPLLVLNGSRRLFTNGNISGFAGYVRLDAEIDRCVDDISAFLNEKIDRTKAADILEPLERYAALTRAARNRKLSSLFDRVELFRISGHNEEELAAKCLERRNRRRLIMHAERAVDDLIQGLKDNTGIPEIKFRIIEIVELLDDEKTKTRLSTEIADKKASEQSVLVTKIAA